jgi:hypothetical protein
MKRFKILFLAIICLLACSINAKAEFFSDVIVTSPSGIWTDARAYATLNAAITAVGANQRTIKIVSPQVVTSLTVPANVTLEFDRDGSITNSGQLTINTKNIIAPNRQIFTGAGNIDFASGSVIKTGWFNSIESAFALTTNDTVTLIVSKAQTITASYSPGTNVHLKWEAPGNILTVNAGVTVSNINQITAGNYQLFAGAGNFRFRDGTNLNSSWFSSLRSIITWVSTNRVTLTLQGTLLVDFTDTVPTNIHIDVDTQRGLLSISGGVTLTINSNIQAGPYQWFSGAGTVVLPSVVAHYPEWYSSGTFTQATIEAALTAIGTTNKATLLLRPGTWVISSNADWSTYTNVTFKIVPGAKLSGAFTVNIPNIEAGLYQIFDSTLGAVTLSGVVPTVYPQWWGASPSATAAVNTAALQSFLDAVSAKDGNAGHIPAGIYEHTGLTLTKQAKITGDGHHTRDGGTRAGGTILWNTHLTNASLTITDPNSWGTYFSDIVFRGDRTAQPTQSGNGLVLTGEGSFRFDRCTFEEHGGNGVYLGTTSHTWGVIFDNCQIYSNKLNGIYGRGISTAQLNAVSIRNCHIQGNVQNGINIWGTVINIYDNVIEGNLLAGIKISSEDLDDVDTQCITLNIRDNHFEGDLGGEIVMEGSYHLAAPARSRTVQDFLIEGNFFSLKSTTAGVTATEVISFAYNNTYDRAQMFYGTVGKNSWNTDLKRVYVSGNLDGKYFFCLVDDILITSTISSYYDTSLSTTSLYERRTNYATGPPTIIPWFYGQEYLDLTLQRLWVATGTAAVTDWQPISDGIISTLANDATPSITGGKHFLTGGTTTITDFDDGYTGQIIIIIAEHSVTITDGTNIFLNGSANFVMAATDTLTLIQKADGKWYEIGRSDN